MTHTRSDLIAELLSHAAAAAGKAADLLLNASWSTGVDVRLKSPFDQVCDVDLQIERCLRDALLRASPGSGIIGEELGEVPGQSVLWVVDPIDGTDNFVCGLPLAAISIGIRLDGELCAGIVIDPYRQESFSGGIGHPLAVNGVAFRPQPAASRVPVVLTDLPHPGENPDAERELNFYRGLISRSNVRRIGSSALALAWIAAGRANIACNLQIKPWDVAGGAALVRAAGGIYHGIGSGGASQPAEIAAPGFVASSRTTELSSWIVRELAEIGAAPAMNNKPTAQGHPHHGPGVR
jgi:myo-inositol-1(or 4)-monophosphatase